MLDYYKTNGICQTIFISIYAIHYGYAAHCSYFASTLGVSGGKPNFGGDYSFYS